MASYQYTNITSGIVVIGSIKFQPGESKTFATSQAAFDASIPSKLSRSIDGVVDNNPYDENPNNPTLKTINGQSLFGSGDLAIAGGGGGGATTPRTISSGTYTLQASDSGANLSFTGACVVTVPASLPDTFWVNMLTTTVNQLTISPINGTVTVNNSYGHTKSSGMPFAIASLSAVGTNSFVLTGRTGV